MPSQAIVVRVCDGAKRSWSAWPTNVIDQLVISGRAPLEAQCPPSSPRTLPRSSFVVRDGCLCPALQGGPRHGGDCALLLPLLPERQVAAHVGPLLLGSSSRDLESFPPLNDLRIEGPPCWELPLLILTVSSGRQEQQQARS
jgi:hypothetical protein